MTKITVTGKPSAVAGGPAHQTKKVNIKNTEPKATGVPMKNGGSGPSVNGRQGRTEGEPQPNGTMLL
ncbi:hypothetical protein HDU76_013070 [Blyttiomyces sp. JEL0837]|nr:hypothetical protein HDU76_013070 [Blyttiomyces sp. JEL0837]